MRSSSFWRCRSRRRWACCGLAIVPSSRPGKRTKTSTNTTATLMCLRRCCGLWVRQVRVEDGRDAIPQARADPEGITGIDRLPGSARGGRFAPRRSAVHHRKHALQLAPQIATGASPPWDRWGEQQQGRDLLPVLLGQRSRARYRQDGDRSGRRGPGLCRRRTLCPTGLMPPASDRLVLAPPRRPVQVVGALGACRLGQEQQQAAHLGHGQGDEVLVASPPLSAGPASAAPAGRASRAARRVTSK
jgi:hypothetical protein